MRICITRVDTTQEEGAMSAERVPMDLLFFGRLRFVFLGCVYIRQSPIDVSFQGQSMLNLLGDAGPQSSCLFRGMRSRTEHWYYMMEGSQLSHLPAEVGKSNPNLNPSPRPSTCFSPVLSPLFFFEDSSIQGAKASPH